VDEDLCLFSDANFTQFPEVRDNNCGKKGEDKEHHAVNACPFFVHVSMQEISDII
jgi:hypothetical protein